MSDNACKFRDLGYTTFSAHRLRINFMVLNQVIDNQVHYTGFNKESYAALTTFASGAARVDQADPGSGMDAAVELYIRQIFESA